MAPQPQFAESDSTGAVETPPGGEPETTSASETGAPTAEPAEQQPRRRRRAWRIVLICLIVLAVLGAGGAVAAAFYVRSVESKVERVEAFDQVPEEARPVKVAQDARNILILGSDSRDPDSDAGSRTDTIILAHLPKDRASAQLISIPRDTWVHVPASKDGKHGNRDAKINASYAWGGIPLMVQSVEKFTGVRIDHVAVIDFAGFTEIVDALGGINIQVDRTFTSIHPPFRTFRPGMQRMDGATALDYSRQRKQFPDGDFARVRHQQQVIRAILDKAASGGLLGNPGKLNDFLKATADAVSVDKTLSIFDTATELRAVRSSNLTFITSPSKGTGRVGSESVVFANTEKAKTFYDAVRRDAVPEIMSAAK